MLKKIERSNADKILRRFANRIKPIGFIRTKTTFFVRDTDLVAEFIHVHKYTFGPYFRIHTCIRVLNDARDFIALTGPIESEFKTKTYKFEFDESKESVENCAEEMANFVENESVPWFKRWENTKLLLDDDSPLNDQDKQYLTDAMQGNVIKKYVEQSRALLKLQ